MDLLTEGLGEQAALGPGSAELRQVTRVRSKASTAVSQSAIRSARASGLRVVVDSQGDRDPGSESNQCHEHARRRDVQVVPR
ncbi:hypothetical protein DL991_25050 [Amycolatopsis sp. WAC 01375]|nr:hypothetical protein DL991_25050 [Amycolatopsis sp. WAC 01375]RSN33299.1 hypothetical protein DL990_15050 [Amycolatopsis sp. WAC 01416]